MREVVLVIQNDILIYGASNVVNQQQHEQSSCIYVPLEIELFADDIMVFILGVGR